ARRDDGVDLEIAVARRRRPDAHRLVRLAHMERVGVRVGVDRDGLDAEPLAGADDAARDLAAIGDEDLRERRRPGRGLRPPGLALVVHDAPEFTFVTVAAARRCRCALLFYSRTAPSPRQCGSQPAASTPSAHRSTTGTAAW